MLVRGVTPAGSVGLQHCVNEVLFIGGHQPGEVVRGVADPQVRPAGDRRDPPGLDEQVVLVQVAVDHARVEAPQGYVFHGMFPAAQQRGGDLPCGRGLVELVQPPLAELIGRVAGKIGVADQRPGQVVDGSQGGPDLAGDAARTGGQFLDAACSAREVRVDERAQGSQPHTAGYRRHEERQLGPHGRSEGAEDQELRFQPGAGLRVPRRPDPPALAF